MSPQEKKLLEEIHEKVKLIAASIEKTQIADYVALMNSPKRLFYLNVLSGVARGIGIAIGFTFFAATIVYLLQKLGALNLPIVGDYIADLVRIVQAQLKTTY